MGLGVPGNTQLLASRRECPFPKNRDMFQQGPCTLWHGHLAQGQVYQDAHLAAFWVQAQGGAAKQF